MPQLLSYRHSGYLYNLLLMLLNIIIVTHVAFDLQEMLRSPL